MHTEREPFNGSWQLKIRIVDTVQGAVMPHVSAFNPSDTNTPHLHAVTVNWS